MASKNIFTQSKKKKAITLAQAGNLSEAKVLLEQVCKIDPVDSDAWFMLGVVNGKLEDTPASIECLRRVISLRPDHALAQFNLGVALHGTGNLEEAVMAFKQSLRVEPTRAETYQELTSVFVALGQMDEAIEGYLQLLRHKPSDSDAHLNVGTLYHHKGNLSAAISCYRNAVKHNPASASGYDNLGNALSEIGEYDESVVSHRKALELDPRNIRAHSNLLLTMHYSPAPDKHEVFEEHVRWGDAQRVIGANKRRHAGNIDADRKLRLGYVSSDFRAHSVAHFFEPLLKHHDRESFEIYCYSGVQRPDDTTERIRALSNGWKDVGDKDDVTSARFIEADEIDILIDLAGHTAGTGLKIFTHKPAPIQVTYLGYPDTTGLDVVDYRLTDWLADPEGEDAFYVEKLVRLSNGFLCYKPLENCPDVSVLPALAAGYITLGSFNNLAKLNKRVVALWADLMHKLPNARLLLKNPQLTDVAARDRYYKLFEDHGLAKERVELIGRTPTQAEHLAMYSRIDVALDSFPYNGTTTTCEALWMGVPVVTLAGELHHGRVGVSLLSVLGRPEWVADTSEQYLDIVAGLAQDINTLALVRENLRGQMAASPLCDGAAFACKVESAYREMWRNYCDTHSK